MTNDVFANAKGKLGFGCMRLPMRPDGEVDAKACCEMFDYFLAHGFNYFDTARPYLKGKSETVLCEALTSRHARDEFVLVDKLSTMCFNTREEIRPLFESQLEACGADYFDIYLMHAQNADTYAKYQRLGAYEEAYAFKADGRIRHFGISFHDTADVLERILTDHPEVECVQLQLNYADWDDPAVQSRACYEVCTAHGKPVMVMEPLKGGTLVNLPEEALAAVREEGAGSPAGLALRFAASHENVRMVLSGMGDVGMVCDNVATMSGGAPFSEAEQRAVERVVKVLRGLHAIPCTACRYCTDGCPKHISIPDLFACYNARKIFNDWNQGWYYNNVYTKAGGRASDCIRCGKCERACPQHLKIRDLLTEVAAEFE